jgi:hypothetical protein
VFDLEIEKVRSARNARVVISHRLLAAPLEVVVTEVKTAFNDAAQILFDSELVLGGWRHDPRTQDRAVAVNLVLVQEQPSRRFSDPGANPGFGDNHLGWRARRLVSSDET